MGKLLFVLHSHKAGKIGCASTMTRKKKDFLVIVFGLHYLCIEFAVFGLLITLQNKNSS